MAGVCLSIMFLLLDSFQDEFAAQHLRKKQQWKYLCNQKSTVCAIFVSVNKLEMHSVDVLREGVKACVQTDIMNPYYRHSDISIL